MSTPASLVTELQHTLYRTIPMAAFCQFQIERLDPSGIVARAPLQPNINLHGTAFAGAQYTLATLTAWSYGQYLLQLHQIDAELVMGKGEIRYRRPVCADITTEAVVGHDESERYLAELTSSRRARLSLTVSVAGGAAEFVTTLVATPRTVTKT